MSSIVLTGVKDFVKYIDTHAAKVEKAIDNGVVDVATEIMREAILSINTQSAGEVVTRNGRKHTVSLKGEAPNTDTGRLVGSIAIAHKSLSQQAIVYSDLDYAAYLEFALDRPWLQPAVNKKKPMLKAVIAEAVQKALK